MTRVLVIDDNVDLRSILRLTLEANGFDVAVASEGAEGLEEMERSPADIVITDLFMPEKEGMETIFELRQRFPQVKIVAMSGGAPWPKATDYLAFAPDAGADAVLRKPFESSELIRIIRKIVR